LGSAEGFESITLASADGTASAEFVACAEQGKTMSFPLLYPWANRLARFGYRAAGKDVTLSEADYRLPRDDGGLPIHGVLPGLLRWDVEDAPARRAHGDDDRGRGRRCSRPGVVRIPPYARVPVSSRDAFDASADHAAFEATTGDARLVLEPGGSCRAAFRIALSRGA